MGEEVQNAANIGSARPRSARTSTVDLCLADEVKFADLSFGKIVPLLYASPHNPGADEMVRELASCFRPDKRPGVSLVAPPAIRRGVDSSAGDDSDEQSKPADGHIFVLYLTEHTWLGDEGEALADEVRRYRYSYVYLYIYIYRERERGG